MDIKKENKRYKTLKSETFKLLQMDSRGLGYIFYKKLKEYGNSIMQIDAITGEEDTFENFRTKCVRTALHLRSKGFLPQDKITICTNNSLDAPVPLIASIFTGVIPNTLDPSFSLDDFKYYLQLIKPKAVFITSDVEHKFKEAAKAIDSSSMEIIVFGAAFNDFLKPIEGEETFVPFLPLSVKDTVLILFSSGTTGKPKAICLSHIGLYQITVSGDIFDEGDRALFYSSLYWISQVLVLFANIIYGFVKLVYPKFDNPRTFCDIVRDYNVLTVFLPPSNFVEILNYCTHNGITLSLDNVLLGGAPTAKEHLKMANKAFPSAKFVICYGQTEAGFISVFPRKKNFTKKHEEKVFNGSCGSIVPGITLQIINLDTEEPAGPNEEGEIRIQSSTLMNGYYGVDSSDVYDSQGWFKTGDIGYYDQDEFLYIVGRCKEMLKYRSFPVSPAILEDIVSQHPAVKQCVVTGIPHVIDGDHPVAFVILKQGYKVDPDEIKKFVDNRVDDRKKLRGGVILTDKIPLTPTGKPQRLELRKMLQTFRAP